MKMEDETFCYNAGKELVYLAGKIKEKTRNIKDYIKKEPFCVTYPILGNLSEKVQNKLESMTKGKYNAEKATITTFGTNCIAYSIGGKYLLNIEKPENILITGVILGGAELIPRIVPTFSKNKPKASLLGKIVSLPIEFGLGLYDGIKGEK